MSATTVEPAGRRYLRASRVVTATDRGVIEDGVVAVEGSRIAAVAPAAELAEALRGAPVEAFADATLLPGLVDAHAHLTLAADRRTYEQMTGDPDEMMALVSIRNLRAREPAGRHPADGRGGRGLMNIPVLEDRNGLDVRPTRCPPGSYVVLRAEMDCFVAFSACPQDILPIHGEGGAPPRDCHFAVLDQE